MLGGHPIEGVVAVAEPIEHRPRHVDDPVWIVWGETLRMQKRLDRVDNRAQNTSMLRRRLVDAVRSHFLLERALNEAVNRIAREVWHSGVGAPTG